MNIRKHLNLLFTIIPIFMSQNVFAKEYHFEVSDFSYKTSAVIANLNGPTQKKTNKIIISSLKGDTAASGTNKIFHLDFKYENDSYFFEIENAQLTGSIDGDFIGNSDASYDKINLNTSLKIKQNAFAVGKKWKTSSEKNKNSFFGLKLKYKDQSIILNNKLNIDWIKHSEEFKIDQNQLGLGLTFQNYYNVYQNLDFFWDSTYDVGLYENSKSGIKSNQAAFAMGFSYKLQDVKNEELINTNKKEKRFVQISGQTNLATSKGVTDVSEDDHHGTLTFADNLALNGEELAIASSVFPIKDSGWVLNYLEGSKNANFVLQDIENILGANNDFSGSANAKLKLKTIQLDRLYLKPKYKFFQPYFFTGIKIGKSNLSYETQSSYRGKNEISFKEKDIYLAGLAGGVGVRRYFNDSSYIYTQQSLSHYNGKPFGTNLIINESNLNLGIGVNF